MTDLEHREHSRLLRLWARGNATRRQILRCMELDRKSSSLFDDAAAARYDEFFRETQP